MVFKVYSLIKGYWSPLNPIDPSKEPYRSLIDPFKGNPRYSLIKGYWDLWIAFRDEGLRAWSLRFLGVLLVGS